MVDVSRCQCYRDNYNSRPRVKMWNNITVLLNDSSGYQVFGKAESLSLSISSIAGGYKIMSIIDNGNGSYVAAYMPLAVGVYKINVAYDNVTIPSCFMVDYTHSGETFFRSFQQLSYLYNLGIIFVTGKHDKIFIIFLFRFS